MLCIMSGSPVQQWDQLHTTDITLVLMSQGSVLEL